MNKNTLIHIISLNKKTKEKIEKLTSLLEDVQVVSLTDRLQNNYFDNSEVEFAFIELNKNCITNMDLFKKIKATNPHAITIAVVDKIDSSIEKKIVSLGATTYIHSNYKNIYKVSNKIKKFLDLFRSGEYAHAPVKSVKLNIFGKETRCIKSIATINNDVDMMDLGLWITEKYSIKHKEKSQKFKESMELLYYMIKRSLIKDGNVEIEIEEDYNSIFLTMPSASCWFVKEVEEKYHNIKERYISKNFTFSIMFSIFPSTQKESLSGAVPYEKRALKEITKEESFKEEEKQKEISAAEFILSLSAKDLYMSTDLRDYEKYWRDTCYYILKNRSNQEVFALGKSIIKYGNILRSLKKFDLISHKLIELGMNIKESNLLVRDIQNVLNITDLLAEFVEVLIAWRRSIFEEQSVDNVNYIDPVIIDYCEDFKTLLKNLK